MKSSIITFFFGMLMLTGMMTYAQEDLGIQLLDKKSAEIIAPADDIGDPIDFNAALIAGADYLVHAQADVTEDNAGNGDPDTPDDPDDGGWDWKLTDPNFTHSTNASPTNIYGATAMGLYYAYLETNNAGYMTALQDAADVMVANANIRSASDLVFLMRFQDLPGVAANTYQDAAKAKYDSRITTYGTATAFAEYIRDVRAGQGYENGIIPWDISTYVSAAQMLESRYPGNNYAQDADDMAEVIYQDSYQQSPGYFDLTTNKNNGWEPGYGNPDYYWYTLGITGVVEAFVSADVHTAELPGLITILLDCQYDSGAFSYCYGANTGDEDWQSTAYAVMALALYDQATYQDEINWAAYWTGATQQAASGGWVYGSGNHYPEIGGENTVALYFGESASEVWVDDDFTASSCGGHVWGYDAFDNIQDGVDAVTAGGTVNVAAGTYTEQVLVNKEGLSILGEDVTTTIIESPATLAVSFSTSKDYKAIVCAHTVNSLTLSDLTIDGNGQGNGNNNYLGLAFWNSGGTVTNVDITRVRETPFSGAQHGVSVYAYNDTGGPYTIAIDGMEVTDYQKNAFSLSGDGLTIDLDNISTYGAGPTGVTAQNGIQVGYGASGTIDDCNVYDVEWTGATWTATGVLLYEAGNIALNNVDVSGCQTSYYIIDGDAQMAGCDITNVAGNGMYVMSSSAKGGAKEKAAPVLENYSGSPKASLTVTMDNCVVTGNNTGQGISAYAYSETVTMDITNCTVNYWTFGIVAYENGGTVDVEAHDCDLSNNDWGFWTNANAAKMEQDATYNWWGHATGPYHPVNNPAGQGDTVSDNVLIDPWYANSGMGNQIDIAINEIGCAGFEVVLRPNFDPVDQGITNVQFTIKYPESVDLTDLNPMLGFIQGYSPTPPAGYKYITYVGVNLLNTGWVSGGEYQVLTFSHDQSGSTPITDDFVIVPDSEANNFTEYYAEYLGSDVTGYIFANAEDVLLTGCPVWNETKDLWYYEIQAAIDDANIPGPDVIRAYNVIPNNGVFVEDLVIDRAVTLYGPNVGISPNTGTRVSEVVIHPATIDAVYGELTKVQASDVTIDGFTFNGDNPSLSSGFIGTNGADIDVCEAITVYVDNVENLTVTNNIIQNFSYFGVSIFGDSYSAPSTSGHLVHDNLFQDFGLYNSPDPAADYWGGGVLIYNDQYTRITDNVMTNVRIGIQTGNFHDLNPGDPMYQVIDNNTIQTRRRGVFYNLHTGNTVALTLSNNTITALADANETVWDGILMSSLSDVSGIATNNFIDGSGITVPSEGYEIWNVKSDAPALITGGIVENVDVGVFANNYEGYNSNGGDGAHAIVQGMTITPNTGGTGIYLLDSPDYSGASAANVDVEAYNNVISGGAEGVKLEENNYPGSVSATVNDNSITGNSGYGINSGVTNQVDATCNWWASADINTVASEVNGDVVYLPYLTTNTENVPSAWPYGFDPAGPCQAPLPMTVLLQSPYDVGSGLMTTDLNTAGAIPNNQPFNTAPWNYSGTETLPSPLPSDVVDWVLVELRTDETTTYDRVAGLLYEDGSVQADFSTVDPNDPYYIVIWHRNHMPVMSANAIDLDSYTFPYDFTDLANLYGPALPTPVQPAIEVDTDVYAMIAGDVTSNGEIKYSGPGNDRGPIIALIVVNTGSSLLSGSTFGYYNEDVTMDHEVKYINADNDRDPIAANINTLTGQPWLNLTYQTAVPGGYVSTKDATGNEGPVYLSISETETSIELVLQSSEIIKDGLIDNIQFTLSWDAEDDEIEKMINAYSTLYGITPQMAASYEGKDHQIFVGITPFYLPPVFGPDDELVVMSFPKHSDFIAGERISVAENAFTDEYNGMYYVSVWGKDFTGDFKNNLMGEDDLISGQIRVYPNPATNGYINLQVDQQNEPAMIEIFDAQGRSVLKADYNAGSLNSRINVSNLQSGLYMMKLSFKNSSAEMVRFVIN